MATWPKHPVLHKIQKQFFKYTWAMFASEFQDYYTNLPILLHNGTIKRANVHQYISGASGDRTKRYAAFRSTALKFYEKAGKTEDYDWLKNHHTRVMACFYGQAMPEELATVCRMMVETGQKTEMEIADWAGKNFGLDCCGFVSSYFTALGTFDGRQYYIPKYKQIGGVAKTVSDVTYDCAILFARKKMKKDKDSGLIVESDDWEVRPNPGNKSHIMVTNGWIEHGRSLSVSQSGSSLGGLHTSVYEIVKAPSSTSNSRAVWQIKRQGKTNHPDNLIPVFITREMPPWAQAE